MEIDISKEEDPTIEEEILRKIMEKWRNLDERFILEDKKNIQGNLPKI